MVPLIYVAQPTSDMILIAEVYNPSNAYANYYEEMVKIVRIIEPGHAANATEEDGPLSVTFIVERGKFWDFTSTILHATGA